MKTGLSGANMRMEQVSHMTAICVYLVAVAVTPHMATAQSDPMEASLRAKAGEPWFAQFMDGEPIVEGFPGESAVDRAKRLKSWRDAQVGLFLHWGP
jgi:hypothetical protein